MKHDSSRTPFDAPSADAMPTQLLPTNSPADNLTTNSLSPMRGLHSRAKMLVAALVGAVVALTFSALSNHFAERMSAPDRAQIVAVGSATLVRENQSSDDQWRDNSATSSTRSSDESVSDNSVVMSIARDEIALQNVPAEDRPRLQAHRDEDKAITERELLEDKKRAIERQIEDAQAAERRRNEDKTLDETRAADKQRRLESRAQEDKQISEQRAQAQITPSLTSAP